MSLEFLLFEPAQLCSKKCSPLHVPKTVYIPRTASAQLSFVSIDNNIWACVVQLSFCIVLYQHSSVRCPLSLGLCLFFSVLGYPHRGWQLCHQPVLWLSSLTHCSWARWWLRPCLWQANGSEWMVRGLCHFCGWRVTLILYSHWSCGRQGFSQCILLFFKIHLDCFYDICGLQLHVREVGSCMVEIALYASSLVRRYRNIRVRFGAS